MITDLHVNSLSDQKRSLTFSRDLPFHQKLLASVEGMKTLNKIKFKARFKVDGI